MQVPIEANYHPTNTQPAQVRAIVVDDQAVFRRAARALIEATPGFELVGEATSGSDGLALANQLNPDLVLMDVRMPGIDGIDATRQLTAVQPQVVVILISLERPVDEASAKRRCGAAAFIAKQDLSPAVLQSTWAEQVGASS